MIVTIVIIVIKITITVIMKIIIVLKLMKTVVQSHNPKTYICSNSDNAQQEVSKILLNAQHCHSKCNAARVPKTDLHTLSSTLRPKGAIVFRVLLQ